MGKATFSSSFTNASDATFRAWVGAFLGALDAAGAARAPDTGQIDPSTITVPGSVNGVAGYAMYFLDDALHATHPVYIRLQFGRGATTASRPAMWLTIGKATDGAGGMSQILLPETNVSGVGVSTESTTVFDGIAVAGDGYLALMPGINDSTTDIRTNYVLVERSRTHDGAPYGDALLVAGGAPTSAQSHGHFAYVPPIRAITYSAGGSMEWTAPVVLPARVNGNVIGSGSSLAAGGIGPVFPWVLMAPSVAPWQSCVFVTYPPGDFPGGDFETTLCGGTATFRPVALSVRYAFGITAQPNAQTATYNRTGGLAVRWED